MLPPPLLKQRELQDYYGVSDWTVNKWVRDGCPVERLRGGGRRFDLEAVKAWHAEDADTARSARATRSARALSARISA
jgi:phage terminase Nu1 subunit (DNA packaging protein)